VSLYNNAAGDEMTKRSTRKKRSKLTIIILAPVLALTFMVGWTLYWIGNTKPKQPQAPTPKMHAKQDPVQLIAIPTQEEHTITNN
jgi:flagellar basal body-associated protein FliL